MWSGGSGVWPSPFPPTSASTSCLRTRPPRPVPWTVARSMWCSAAMRVTTGENRVDGPAASTAVSMRASTVPTSTVSPPPASRSASTPVAGAGTSVSILSVEISQIVSSAATGSPTPFRHSTSVPSATDTPSCGIVTSVVEELTARLPHAIDARQDGLLERGAERDRHVGRRHADDGPVEVLERALGDERGDLGAGGAGPVRLIEDDDLRAPCDRREDRVLV